ncbi:sugar ABC transporter ATP-binding protein [Alicyclobacillus tolerans]|uniref:sugar ABC transporter ATP-binding protein n=1 Tax=Alicyclobacillus tolerans TaxID=90970 RepID=UPI001F21A2F0|nr:sugar ABC transporter ATP-binding protein [Alicyclobacillus tolerans]MCF8566709.1 sugar ABC transporter ATP-binding protein [Alicyclobacillus tolerans]
MYSEQLLQVENLQKSYSGVTVLHDFSLVIRPGEVHALIGHNGAGKSTVIRMLSGSESPTAGRILLDGQEVALSSPRIARHLGIYTVFQELRLIDELTVAQNIFLGKELSTRGFVNRRKMEQRARELLCAHNLGHLDVTAKVKTLSHAEKQLVEIVSSLQNDARLILLDEPTTALQAAEIQELLQTVRDLSEKGIAFLFITHKIDEAFSVCQHVTVLRNGHIVSSKPIEEISQQQVLAYVAGHELVEKKQREPAEFKGAEVVLNVQGLHSDVLDIPEFAVRRGEVVGLYGLVGSGRTEFVETLFGARPYQRGHLQLLGRPYRPKTPRHAVRQGVYLVTEERKRNGIIPQLDSRTNMVIGSLSDFQSLGFLKRSKIEQRTDELVQRLSIKGDIRQPILRMSGGNQQKVLIARWLLPNGRVLLLDEPTKGVDIGVKAEIHAMIRELAARGYAILVVSSEVEEVVAVSDAVAVMHKGRIKVTLRGGEISEDRLLTESLEGHEYETKIPQ